MYGGNDAYYRVGDLPLVSTFSSGGLLNTQWNSKYGCMGCEKR